jgi:hypothetical protein
MAARVYQEGIDLMRFSYVLSGPSTYHGRNGFDGDWVCTKSAVYDAFEIQFADLPLFDEPRVHRSKP